MSYAAIEVELHEGRVIPRGSEPLPEEGSGILVILSTRTESAPSWQTALAGIRARQQARGHVPRTAEEVNHQITDERENWR